MAQDLFRQSQSQWRNRHGPLTHGHPNLQAAAASRVGLPHGSGTLPSPPDCCTLSAPTADLTPELLRSGRREKLIEHSRTSKWIEMKLRPDYRRETYVGYKMRVAPISGCGTIRRHISVKVTFGLKCSQKHLNLKTGWWHVAWKPSGKSACAILPLPK